MGFAFAALIVLTMAHPGAEESSYWIATIVFWLPPGGTLLVMLLLAWHAGPSG